jgi:hypothetical protein
MGDKPKRGVQGGRSGKGGLPETFYADNDMPRITWPVLHWPRKYAGLSGAAILFLAGNPRTAGLAGPDWPADFAGWAGISPPSLSLVP